MSTVSSIRTVRGLALAAVVATAAGCVEVGPNYVRPTVSVPPAYKEARTLTAPQAISASGRWWQVYHDPTLASLIAKVGVDNQSLKAAAANVAEARALLAEARGEAAPQAALGTVKTGRHNENDFGLVFSWELDLWGRIRRNIEAHGAAARASADDLAAATLSMQAAAAQAYFGLREKGALLALLRPAAKLDAQALRVTANQYAQGLVSHADLAKAHAQLAAAQLQLDQAEIVRAQLEHALAVMLGQPPADFSLAPAPFDTRVPAIPAGLPSTLLQRRPDIAAAERRVAAASAQIGVSVAERFPSIKLIAGVAVRKGLFATADVKAPLFTGGRLKAGVAHARAAWAGAVANYRQTVLDGFREVEDNLVAQNLLAQAAKTQTAAARAARDAERVARNQFHAGVTGYPELAAATAVSLDSQRAALGLHLSRLDASVNLAKALGGGWHVGANAVAAPAAEAASR